MKFYINQQGIVFDENLNTFDEKSPIYPIYYQYLVDEKEFLHTDKEVEKDKLEVLKDFMKQKKIDGEAYFNEIDLALTIILAGLPIQELVPVNQEIKEKIDPIIVAIYGGNWFDAYMTLWVTEDYKRPTSTLLMQTFDNVKVRVKQYFETNYPR